MPLTPWQAAQQMRNRAMRLVRACVAQKGVPTATREDLLDAVKQWDRVEQGLANDERAMGILSDAEQERFLNK